MFFHYILLYCLKMVTLFYLKNVLESKGNITVNDVGISLGMNAILYYVVTVLSGLITTDEWNNLYFLDLITTSIMLGLYIKYIERLNDNHEIENFDLNEMANQEACKMNDERNMLIMTKPVMPIVEYPKKNIIYMLCLCPYFIVY